MEYIYKTYINPDNYMIHNLEYSMINEPDIDINYINNIYYYSIILYFIVYYLIFNNTNFIIDIFETI
jgi:hypothetical protein